MDPEKVAAIQQWEAPKTVKGVRSFLTSSTQQNHKKRSADVKKHIIPFISSSTFIYFKYSSTQALRKEVYPVKVNASQGQFFHEWSKHRAKQSPGLKLLG